MGPAQGGDWRAKLLAVSVVGIICAAIYPTVVVPLQIAYGGAPRPERDPSLKPGFQKKSMWGSIDAAIKDQQQPQQQQGADAGGDEQQRRR